MEPRQNNNFDLIRILAAFQVLITHAVEGLQIENDFILFVCDNILVYFPGVPIFFVISGFLIYSSFERNKDNVIQYIVNRFLRIFPALWVCIVLAFCLMWYDYGISLIRDAPKEIVQWFLAQVSFLQFYTPDTLKFWGVGVPNGSLWTISVEFQFYIILPILFILFNKSRSCTFWVISITLVALFINSFIGVFDDRLHWPILRLGKVFVFTHLHYFMLGIVIQKYWDKVSFLFEGKALIWLIAYFLFTLFAVYGLDLDTVSYYSSTPANFIADILIGGLTISSAYSFIGLSDRLLKGQDISYGVYIYHMLVVNILVHRGYLGKEIYLLVVICGSVVLAILSWIIIERKVLESKYLISGAIHAYLKKY